MVGSGDSRARNDAEILFQGPGGFGNFLPLEKKLADNSAENQALRDHIFGRLREPDFRNNDQAHVQLMPRLSGDNGAYRH